MTPAVVVGMSAPSPGSEGAINMSGTWRDQARCRGVDPQIFHPSEEDEAAAAVAKDICGLCTVREPCLEYAITSREHDGVWGGLTARERRRLIRQRRRTA